MDQSLLIITSNPLRQNVSPKLQREGAKVDLQPTTLVLKGKDRSRTARFAVREWFDTFFHKVWLDWFLFVSVVATNRVYKSYLVPMCIVGMDGSNRRIPIM